MSADYYPGLSDAEVQAAKDPFCQLLVELDGLRAVLFAMHNSGATLPATPECRALLEATMRVCNWYEAANQAGRQLAARLRTQAENN